MGTMRLVGAVDDSAAGSPRSGGLVARVLALGLALLVAACSTGSSSAGPSAPPLDNLVPQSSVGHGEGTLDLLARDGYTQDAWVTPFERSTGCQVRTSYVSSPDQLMSAMRDGGAGRYDLVSAPADVSLRLIDADDIRPVNINLVPDWKNLFSELQNPPFDTVQGVHYGISLLWRPNVLIYDLGKYAVPPLSWAVLYDPGSRGRITVPDSPMQIADAALYLAWSTPWLGITDPYELTRPQFQAAVGLLEKQRPLVRAYWRTGEREATLFRSVQVWAGAGWPAQTAQLQGPGFPVADTVPQEGATGWADSWLLAARARHPNCAYKWLAWVNRPRVQAEQAVALGAAPTNSLSCRYMDALAPNSCEEYDGNASSAFLDSIRFWTTPSADCGDGSHACVPYPEWQRAWARVVR